MNAVSKSQLPALNLLLENGARVDTLTAGGRSPLMLAAERGSLEVLERLLEAGAEVSVQDKDGLTALMLASIAGNAPCVARLAQSADIALEQTDAEGQTALLWACRWGHLSAVKALCEAGASLVPASQGHGNRAMDNARLCTKPRASEAIQEYLLDVELDREEA